MSKFFEKLKTDNCELIGKYKNAMTKVEIKCPCGKSFFKIPNDAIKCKKNQCLDCRSGGRTKVLNNRLKSITYKEIYCNKDKKNYIYFKCICNKKLKKSKSEIVNQKYWQLCHTCANSKMPARKNDTQQMKKEAQKYGAMLCINKYVDAKTPVETVCSCGAIFKRQWNSMFYYKSFQCPKCSRKESDFETEVCDFVNNLNIKFIKNDKKIINPYELDIVVPDKKIAIECNGIYWHSELMGKKSSYHVTKTDKCLKNGYQLIHIFDYLWKKKEKIYKDFLKIKFGFGDLLSARDCSWRELTVKEEKEFFDENHLQGYAPSKIAYGLFFEQALMMAASFRKSRFHSQKNSRFKNQEMWELIRLASKDTNVVRGGASKLISKFNKRPLISYADYCISNGSVYSKLGFKSLGRSKPGYHYFKNKKVYNRMQFQRKLLKNKLENFDNLKTEWQNMQNNGFNRFYDCGNLIYILYK